MHRLYKKSEIGFAVFWIVAYVVGTGAADSLSRLLGMEKSVTLVYLLLLTAASCLFMKRHDLFRKYGLCKTDVSARRFLYYIPLALMVCCNLWLGVTWNMSVLESALYVLSMLLVGFLEEIIFRGFLFRAMAKDGVRSAIIVSAVTFGVGHLVNLINGSGADLLSNLCQVGYAIAAGFLFVILVYRGGSLWPCILTHSVLNALSAFAKEAPTAGVEILTAVLLAAISLGYTGVLLHTLPRGDKDIPAKTEGGIHT